jgi:hypothetical protein
VGYHTSIKLFKMHGTSNPAYVSDPADIEGQRKTNSETKKIEADRGGWGKDIEFLFSCIALSVGLGE